MNSLFVIAPFWKDGTWVFNDERHGLVEEPFVCGSDNIISAGVHKIPNAKNGFRLTFSSSNFPNSQLKALRANAENNGYWYEIMENKIFPSWTMIGKPDHTSRRGWLCPATLCYFPEGHPEELYVRFDSLDSAFAKGNA